jgi:hypothetical protein
VRLTYAEAAAYIGLKIGTLRSMVCREELAIVDGESR